jgi:[lysine-biosynthesis-protein LysW]--L-2-aminoadipate ligase
VSRLRILYSRLRAEEKQLACAAGTRGIPYLLEDARQSSWKIEPREGDVFLARCIGHLQNTAVARLLEASGARVVNPARVMETCGDKLATSAALAEAGIPQPSFRAAFSEEAALDAAEELGYPVVFKPACGSWGRLLALASNRETAEAIVEHKAHLGAAHQVYYMQSYVEKGGFDVRAFVVDGRPLCAIRRTSSHWITNTARGGSAQSQPMDRELKDLLEKVHGAIGGDFLAVDLFLTSSGWLVNEVNDGAEFRNSIEPTGVDIPGAVVEMASGLMKRAKREKQNCGSSGPGA